MSPLEPHTEIIHKGKANRPNEFGKLVKIKEGEQQIITDYPVFAERPNDSECWSPSTHLRKPCRRFNTLMRPSQLVRHF